MPTFAGPFDARTESTKRLLAIYWRSVAEINHAQDCDDCRKSRHCIEQLLYERSEAAMSLRSRDVTSQQLDAVAGLARMAALQNPDLHDFVLPMPERNHPTCDRKKALPC